MLQGACAADGRNRPFLPFIGVVRNAFGVTDRDGHELAERKLRAGLETLGIAPDAPLPYLLNLLGFDSEVARLRKEDSEIVGIRMRDLLCELLRERCRQSPVILFIDDLHWIDSASEEVLIRIVKEEAK